MKKTILLLTLSFFSISTFSQATTKVKTTKVKTTKVKTEKVNTKKENTENNFFDNFIISADYNLINAMHLDGVDELDLSSFVIKIKKDINLSNNFNLNGSVGYSLGFEYIPIELGFSYMLINNLSANIGCGLYSITDDRWVTLGLDGEEPSDNDFGLYFGIDYMLNDNIGLQINYNSIESPEDIEVSSMSLTSLSFGLSYKL